MSQLLLAGIQVGTQIVWGTSDEEIAQEIRRAEKHGWAWDGKVQWRHVKESKVCAAVLVYLAAARPEDSNPRIVLTRV